MSENPTRNGMQADLSVWLRQPFLGLPQNNSQAFQQQNVKLPTKSSAVSIL